MTLATLSLFAAVVVGTWNGNWFPSGRAEHRAHPDVEEATIAASAKMLAAGLRAADPAGTNDVILCLNEIRGPHIASNLVARIGRSGLRVAVVTRYRRRDRFDQQQDVIATTLPVAEAHWSRWKSVGKTFPPRGYAFAAVEIAPAVTAAVYAVHLKSDYGATTKAIAEANREKRAAAVRQVIDQERPRRGRPSRPVILAGDLNADRYRPSAARESFFGALDEAGFIDPFCGLARSARATHRSRRHGDSTLDYVLCRGLTVADAPRTVPSDGLSDHWAVFVVLR